MQYLLSPPLVAIHNGDLFIMIHMIQDIAQTACAALHQHHPTVAQAMATMVPHGNISSSSSAEPDAHHIADVPAMDVGAVPSEPYDPVYMHNGTVQPPSPASVATSSTSSRTVGRHPEFNVMKSHRGVLYHAMDRRRHCGQADRCTDTVIKPLPHMLISYPHARPCGVCFSYYYNTHTDFIVSTVAADAQLVPLSEDADPSTPMTVPTTPCESSPSTSSTSPAKKAKHDDTEPKPNP